ncbi:MAG: BrnA antitoxin family protein [Candidatus Doudnabacteria bacterium]|jgi:predicted DNA binding CopG/RHH family protein
MQKKLKKIPKFKTEDEEAEFWNTHDSTDYLDWSKARNVIFPNLKPTSRSISIRIPEYIINQVKVEANKLDIPYQSLMKQYIANGVMKK